jgi:opacity protein-like surface antigen
MTKLTRHFCALVVLLLLLGGASPAARAQAQAAAAGPGSNVLAGGGVSGFESDYDPRKIGGYFAYVDVHPTWRYGLEGEARYLRLHTDEDVTQTTYLGGVHVYLRPQAFRPYAKFLIGVGRINFPFNLGTGSYLALAPGAGIDYVVSDRLTIRAIDFEYQAWPQFTYGAAHPADLHPYGISVGLSYRINRLRRYPRH